MSAKIKEILILSLLILRSSMAEIDCLGLNFFCTTDNTYLPCLYDEVRNITVTTSSRSEACPTGTFCNSLNEEPCDTGIDCEGKEFFCSTTSSFMMCFLRPDGTYWTNSNVVVSCPEHAYCGDIYGTAPCNLHEETTTEEPLTEEPTTEEPTTEEPTTDEPTTEEPATDEPTTTVAPALGELVGYTCAGAGRYPHPTDCRRYISCVVSGSTYKNSQRQCPNDLVYHPDFDGCKLDTTPCDNMDFKCVATGRFADPLNPSKYVWCLKINGAYHALKYTCPVGKIYDGNNACVEPIVISEIETLVGDDTLNIFSTSRRSLSVRHNDEADDERFIESDEMVADRISLNSNEDASVYARDEKYSRL